MLLVPWHNTTVTINTGTTFSDGNRPIFPLGVKEISQVKLVMVNDYNNEKLIFKELRGDYELS